MKMLCPFFTKKKEDTNKHRCFMPMENPHCFCCKGIPNVDVSLQPTCNNEVIAPAVPRTNRKLSNLLKPPTLWCSDLERYNNKKKLQTGILQVYGCHEI
jgi:hypothetical protein